MLKAGVSTDGGATYAINVIPTEAAAGFDVRVSPAVPHADMCATMTRWCREAEAEAGAAEGSLQWKFAAYGGEPLHEHHTSVTDDSNPFWQRLTQVLRDRFAIPVEREIFPAATDSRFLRALKIPCFGFSPMRLCPILLHEHNEYVPVKTFLEGIAVYEALLPAIWVH